MSSRAAPSQPTRHPEWPAARRPPEGSKAAPRPGPTKRRRQFRLVQVLQAERSGRGRAAEGFARFRQVYEVPAPQRSRPIALGDAPGGELWDPPAPLGCDPGVGASVRSGVSVAAEAPRQLDVEGVEVDVADVLEELGGPGVGQGLGQTVSPGLVFLLQGPELGQGRDPPRRPRPRPGRSCCAGAAGSGRRRHGRGPVLVRAGDGLRAARCARGGPRCRRWVRRLCAPSHNPPYALPTPQRPPPLRILTSRRPSTNLEHSMRAVHLPKSHSPQGL